MKMGILSINQLEKLRKGTLHWHQNLQGEMTLKELEYVIVCQVLLLKTQMFN
jgi:hypothetical protein